MRNLVYPPSQIIQLTRKKRKKGVMSSTLGRILKRLKLRSQTLHESLIPGAVEVKQQTRKTVNDHMSKHQVKNKMRSGAFLTNFKV